MSRGSCSATPAATCGNPGINCYWDQECNDNNGGVCCNAGGAGMACKYCGDSGSSGCNQPCPEVCEPGLPDRCTNPKGPPCPANSQCQHATGYCVCMADHCARNGICEAVATTTTTTTTVAPSCERGLNDRCTNSKGPPCPHGSSCQHATGYCVCNVGSCANYHQDACGPVCDANLDQSCANSKGPPCPAGTHCHPASKMCVCELGPKLCQLQGSAMPGRHSLSPRIEDVCLRLLTHAKIVEGSEIGNCGPG